MPAVPAGQPASGPLRQPPSSDPTPAARPPRWPWVPRQCGFQEEHGAADGDKGDAEHHEQEQREPQRRHNPHPSSRLGGRTVSSNSSLVPARKVGRTATELATRLVGTQVAVWVYKNGPAGHFRDGRNDVMKVKGLMAAVISVLPFVSVGCSKQIHELHPASRNPAAVGNINQGDQTRVTRADVEAARAESWWGRPVKVGQDQIIER